MPRRVEDEIDRLYQLPLNEFTQARNALAKEAGPDAARIRRLTKPPLAAWAVNQLHWKRREVYDAMTESAESLRATHKAVLSGREGDIRQADAEHDDAVQRALKATLAIVADSGHPVTDATRQAVLQTLRALPTDDPPGRLSQTLQPGGFELLAGMKVSGTAGARGAKGAKGARGTTGLAARGQGSAEEARGTNKDTAALKRAREAATAAGRALREAEQAARREEFEAAREGRDAERAEKRLHEAEAELDTARQAVADAERVASAAGRRRDAARRRAGEAEEAVAAARKRAEAAQEAFDRLRSRTS